MSASDFAKNGDSSYRPDIDGLRAYAVLAVLLFHLDFEFLPGGFAGVDLFFVISGYLITNLIRNEILKTGSFNFSRFYIRRARRLFPALFSTLALVAVLSVLLFSAEHLQRTSGALVNALFSVSNFYFWLEADYFDVDASVKPLLHTWSLSVEEQFYLVWPALLFFLLRKGREVYTVLVIVAVSLASIALNLAFADGEVSGIDLLGKFVAESITDGKSTIFYLLPFRMYELALGALMVFVVHYRLRANWQAEVLFMLGFGLMISSFVLHSEKLLYPYINALLPCLGGCLLIYSGNQARYSSRLVNNPVCLKIGLISYSLYLIHWPLIVFWKYYSFRAISLYEGIGLAAVSMAAAFLMYRYVETPFRIRHEKHTQYSNKLVLGTLLLAAITMAGFAVSAISSNGFPSRIPIQVPEELESGLIERTDINGLHRRNKWTAAYEIGSLKPEAKTILVIGDSHAGHLKPLAAYLGGKYDLRFRFYTFRGCPAIFDSYKVYSFRSKRLGKLVTAKCAEQTALWEQYITENSFDFVMLATRWNWFLQPADYHGIRIRQDFLVSKRNPQISLEASRKAFEENLDYTVGVIRKTGAQVILVGQVPHSGVDMTGCNDVPDYLISEQKKFKRCNFVPASVAIERSRFSNDIITRVANRHDARRLLGTEVFCEPGEQYCAMLYKGVRLMGDDSHLSSYGAVYLARAWEESDEFPFKR